MKKALFQRAMCLVLTVVMLMTGFGVTASAGAYKDADLPEGEESIYTTLEEMKALITTSDYSSYIEDYEYLKTTQSGLSPIVIDAINDRLEGGSGIIVSESDKCTGFANDESFGGASKAETSVYLPSSGSQSWTYTVSALQEGLYYIRFDYYTCITDESSVSSIQRALKINGKIPFREASYLSFSKFWVYDNVETGEPEYVGGEDYTDTRYTQTAGEGGSYKKIVTTVKDGYKTVTTYTLKQDVNGNSLAPEAKQTPQWSSYYCQDSTGYQQEYFLFYISEGELRITLEAEREPMVIGGIELIPYSQTSRETLTYQEYLAAHPGATAPEGGSIMDIVKIEAEFPDAISDAAVAPSNDNSSAATYPMASGAQLYNIVGETGYNSVGQWSAYKFTVNKDGYYKLGMRYLQKMLEGMYICRTIKLTGGEYGETPTVPFAEANNAQFNYSKDWQSTFVSDDSGVPFEFYFEAGVEYTLYLECSLGSLKNYIQEVERILNVLNDCYLQILQLTGADPDEYRNYQFYQVMPEVLVSLLDESRNLMAVKEDLENLCHTTGSHTATLESVSIIIYQMGLNKGETIAANLQSFKTYLGTLGTWINNSKTSAMSVDSISVIPANIGNEGLEKAEANFFETLWHEFVSFCYSFFTDYDAMGLTKLPGKDDVVVEAWLAVGRDQSQIWRSLIDAEDGYTGLTGNAVDLKLVAGGTLLPSILAGKGPDVYIGYGAAEVINYAIRDAVIGISGNVPTDRNEDANEYNHVFNETWYTYYDTVTETYRTTEDPTTKTVNEIQTFKSLPYSEYTVTDAQVPYEEASFSAAALDTLTLLGVSYGVPQSMNFAMMFYRMDVLARLGVEVPETWSQLLSLLPVLQTNNMDVGISTDSARNYMIYQMGGSFWKYTDSSMYESKYAGARVDLDSDIVIEAFSSLCRLYSDYSMPVSFSVENRFRTGEMPIAIGDYTANYNKLAVYATEINGLWEFSSIPGSVRHDGTYSYASHVNVSATIMPYGCDNYLASWQFIQWQTDASAQSQYGNKMIALVGPSAKYEAANLKALNDLSWTASEKAAIKDQMANLFSIVNYPGSYIIDRYLDFAFLDAVNNGADSTDALLSYIDAMNSEIERKRQEFDLPVVGNEGPPKIQTPAN